MNKGDRLMLMFTALGMLGIYIGAVWAYQKYQAYKATATGATTVQGALGLAGQLFGGS